METTSTKELISYTYIRFLKILLHIWTPKKCSLGIYIFLHVMNVSCTIGISVQNPTSSDYFCY